MAGSGPDPEIPVISVVDLGIVRAPSRASRGRMLHRGDHAHLLRLPGHASDRRRHHQPRTARRGAGRLRTSWRRPDHRLDERRPQQPAQYGIAPPAQQVIDIAASACGQQAAPQVQCPHCGSMQTVCVSQFGSTSCKALYQCKDCREPFDYFKAH
jgi:ring-1,2-phenylacetyl-CoA epoxidase subunit PaaD